MKTKELIEHLKRCDTQYGWTLSWKYAQVIIKRLEELEKLKKDNKLLRELLPKVTCKAG